VYVVISSSRFEFKASAPPDSADYYADHMFRPRSKVWSDKRRTFCFRGFFFHKFPNNTSWLNKICLCLTRVIWESPTLRWFSPLFHPKEVKQKIEWNKGLAHLKYINHHIRNQRPQTNTKIKSWTNGEINKTKNHNCTKIQNISMN